MSDTQQPAAPEVPAKKYDGPRVDYSLEDGKIYRSDAQGKEHIANYDGKILAIIPEWSKFRAPIVRWMNDNNHGYGALVYDGAQDKLRFPAKSENVFIPPKPKKDMAAGDKTPALVEWYKKYHPEEYAARYGVIGPGMVTRVRNEVGDDGQIKKVTYEVDAVLAQRKTHLTEKPSAGETRDEYNDE